LLADLWQIQGIGIAKSTVSDTIALVEDILIQDGSLQNDMNERNEVDEKIADILLQAVSDVQKSSFRRVQSDSDVNSLPHTYAELLGSSLDKILEALAYLVQKRYIRISDSPECDSILRQNYEDRRRCRGSIWNYLASIHCLPTNAGLRHLSLLQNSRKESSDGLPPA
jgi:hypothetical protein